MEAFNSTESSTSPSNTTDYYQYYDYYAFDAIMETRALHYWKELFFYPLAMIFCLLVIGLTLFNKKIVGDYKWFIVNQAIANFIYAMGIFLQYLIIVLVSNSYYSELSYSADPPLWIFFYDEIISNELIVKFGWYAQMVTLFATVFNRWMAIALPTHYSRYMTPRLIPFYCLMCYLILLPFDGRLFDLLSFPMGLQVICTCIPFMFPWLLSIVLSILIYRMLSKHMRGMTSLVDKRRIKESRNILYAIIIQIIVPIFDKAPYYIFLIAYQLDFPSGFCDNPVANIFTKISLFNAYLTQIYTCLIILITMRPYREAVLSLLSPLIKPCRRYIKLSRKNEKTGISATHSTPVVSIRTHSEAVSSNFASSTRVPSQVVPVIP